MYLSELQKVGDTRDVISVFSALIGVAALALCLLCILTIYHLTQRSDVSKTGKPEVYSSSSETSGSSTEISSGTFTRLITSKRQKKSPDQLCATGKRYFRSERTGEEEFVGSLVVNLGSNTSTFGDQTTGLPISSHHNNVYYFDE